MLIAIRFLCQGGRINARESEDHNRTKREGLRGGDTAPASMRMPRSASVHRGAGVHGCIQGSGGISLTLTGEPPASLRILPRARAPIPACTRHIFSLDTDCRAVPCSARLTTPWGLAATRRENWFPCFILAVADGTYDRCTGSSCRIPEVLASGWVSLHEKSEGRRNSPIVAKVAGNSALRRDQNFQGRGERRSNGYPQWVRTWISRRCGSQQVASDGTSFE